MTSVVSSVETKEQHLAEWMVAPKAGRWEHYSADSSAVSLAESSELKRVGNSAVKSVVSLVERKEQHLVEWTVVPKAGQWEHYSADLSVVSLAE